MLMRDVKVEYSKVVLTGRSIDKRMFFTYPTHSFSKMRTIIGIALLLGTT